MITGSKYISSNKIIILIAIFLTLFYNIIFFTNLVRVYPINLNNLGFIISISLVLVCAFILLLSFTCYRKTIKPIIITLLIVSSSSAYFMDSYNVVIDDQMIRNMVMTDASEAIDLVSLKLAMYLLLLGIATSIFVYRAAIDKRPIRQAVTSRIILSVTVLSLAVAVVFMFSSHYASFIREHKPLRYYTNPATFIYSTIKYVKGFTKNKIDVLQSIGQDAIIPADDEHRELIIFVVGESARYDRFSLNGYQKETNPLIETGRRYQL